MAGILLVLAAAGGLAAAHDFLAQRSGAQVADGGELAADVVALLLEGGCVVGVWHQTSEHGARRVCHQSAVMGLGERIAS